MKNNAFCSICTVNYSAYAATLNDSLRDVGHDEQHYVLVVDYDEKKHRDLFKDFKFIVITLDELKIPKIDELIRKYSAFELCNVLRPFFFEWLLNKHLEINYLVYLDTDIYVYSPLDEVFKNLDDNENISVVITPHIKDRKTYNQNSDYGVEVLYMKAGLYNSGFYAFRNDRKTRDFIDWHKDKLMDHCYAAPENYMFVDQKILDFAPLIFDFVEIYKSSTYNIGHWNLLDHPIVEENGRYLIGEGELVFFHFSQLKSEPSTGWSYLFNIQIKAGSILQRLTDAYLLKLESNGYSRLKVIPYGYESSYIKPPLQFIDPLAAKEFELSGLKQEKTTLEKSLAVQQASLDLKDISLAETADKLKQADSKIFNLSAAIMSKDRELSTIYYSRGWKFVIYSRKLLNLLLPKERTRLKILARAYKICTRIVKITGKIKRKSLNLLSNLVRRVFVDRKREVRKPRKINLKSKKVVYVGHYYHSKTDSTGFLLDYLKESFDVEVVLDESWLGKPFPDLSFVNHDYLAVILFQSLPSKEILEKIDNENIIYFPMYDNSVNSSHDYWNDYRGLKMINFSRNLHEKMLDLGLNSIYTQYFPKPKVFSPGRPDEVFFWQRLEKLNINTVAKLLKGQDMKVHIHQAVDPYNNFVKPDKNLEKRLKITYSNWFKTRDEMLNVIKTKGLYIAPREYEGIGMSFLEAMAMGKAVIACDNPTMNEYIKDGETGYLFDLNDPKPVELTDLKKVQKATYDYMSNGYNNWIKERDKIIAFIKKP